MIIEKIPKKNLKKKMIIKITNPRITTIGRGIITGIPMEIATKDQVESIITKCLLKESIIADSVEVEKRYFRDLDYFKSASDLIGDC